MSSLWSFDIISVVVYESESREWAYPKIFSCIPASTAHAATLNPNEIKILVANGLIIFFITGNLVSSNRPKSLPRIPPNCIYLDN